MLRDCKRWKEALHAIEAAGRFDAGFPALYDIQHSIEYGMYGGDVRNSLENPIPDIVGAPQGTSVFDYVTAASSRAAQAVVKVADNLEQRPLTQFVSKGIPFAYRSEFEPIVAHFPKASQLGNEPCQATTSDAPRRCAPIRDTQRLAEEADFAEEHYRLINAINEANRNPKQHRVPDGLADPLQQLLPERGRGRSKPQSGPAWGGQRPAGDLSMLRFSGSNR